MKVLKHCILKTSVFFTLFLAASVTSNAQNRKIGINTVVIDAGHGGPDAGAVGRLYKEKDINLDVALRFGRMISEHYPDVQVIYTRKTDVLIPLAERGDIANRAKADLFISNYVYEKVYENKRTTISYRGALPRKTFSLGAAREKRYYLECRRISAE